VEVAVVAPNKPSTDGAAVDDLWTQHCLGLASRRASWLTTLGALAFVSQFVLVFVVGTAAGLSAVLLVFSAGVFASGVRRRPVERVLSDQRWRSAQVRWKGRRLEVVGTPSVVLDLQGAGPLVRGKIGRHRRAWWVEPDARGDTVVTFRGVPKLFCGRVFH
jgi:hypothetical protein